MVIRVINVNVKAESVKPFIESTVRNRKGSIKEPGILRFDILQDEKDPTQFLLYEVYRNESATLQHKKTEHYLEWRSAAEPMMAEKRQSGSYRVVAPAEEHRW